MEYIKIQGHFIYEKFRSEDYAVFSFKLFDKSEKTITVNGAIPFVEKDLLYELSGSYVEHKKYGMQFEVRFVTIVIPSEHDMIIKYLKSNHFSGIGEKTARSIVDFLGDDCIDKIRNNPLCLEAVPGLNANKVQAIIEGLSSSDIELEKNVDYFSRLGLTYKQILKIDATYGSEAIKTLENNPYNLVYDVVGINFKTANKLANMMQYHDLNNAKDEALITTLVNELTFKYGDTYVLVSELRRVYQMNCEHDNFDDALSRAYFNRHIFIEDEKIYPTPQFNAEFTIAHYLANFPIEALPDVDMDLVLRQINILQQTFGITYDEIQIDAMKLFFEKDFSIITGGPGTGKTTIVKALIELFKHFYQYNSIMCLAPTGRASKRLKELCGCDASTIHSLLKYDLETNKFGINQDNPIMIDCLIIDEASMIDNWLFYNLVLASPNVKKICIIGDKDQLPSVGQGQLLKDFIDSQLISCLQLNKIHRQSDGSDIIDLSLKINRGDVTIDENYQEIKFYHSSSVHIHRYISDVVSHAIDRGYDINDIQVLSCMYRGSAGIDNINHMLQERFNPYDDFKKEVKVGFVTFRENDKILQLKNQSEDDVFNGDIGILIEIVYANEAHDNRWHIFVDYDGVIVEYTNESIHNITLAYCVSVHKAQGSEYPIVIVAMSNEHRGMFKRKLLYTAITRAKKSLILIGSKDIYDYACVTMDENRNTTLVQRMNKAFNYL